MSETTAGDGLGRERLVILVGIMLTVLMAALDQTIVSSALPQILSELGAGTDKITWIVTSYLITMAATMPLYGRLSDMWGRKNLFEFAIVTFLVGSGLCGVAQDVAQLALFRALQGIGGGGLISLAMTIIGDIFSPRERGKYVGVLVVLMGLSNVGGPLLGGWLSDHYTWRLIFLINIPIGIAGLALLEPTLDLPVPDEDHSIDVLGILLLLVATVGVVFISEWGGSDYAWTSWQIVTLALTTVVAAGLFVYQESVVDEPILPLHLFGNRVVACCLGLSFTAGVGRLLVISYIPTFLQFTRGVTATYAGVLLAPMIIGMTGMSFVIGQLLTRTGRYKPFPVIGTVLAGTGFFFLSTIHGGTSFDVLAGYLFVTGGGFGMIMPVLTTAAQNAVGPADLGSVTTTLSYLRSLAGGLGVAIFGSIYSDTLASHMTRIAGRGQGRGSLGPVALHTPQVPRVLREAVISAVSLSIDRMFGAVIPVLVIAFVIALLLPELSLSEQSNVEAMSETESSGTGPQPTTDD
ncbi:MAG: MDR family MFS transporter [Haloarculaceae archaeon]